MNDILESTTVSETVSELTPGQILKAAREAKQINIGEIAQRLLLSKSTIAAIEEDDYSRIPAPVYAEGYLKAYAQFLQIPVDTVLASFRRLNMYSKSEATTEIKAQTQNQACRCRCQELSNLLKGQCRGHVILGAVVILILAVLVIFIGKQFVGKSAEVIHVLNNSPSNLTNAISKNDTDQDKVVSDNQMPIITAATNVENAVVLNSGVEEASKKKHGVKKIDQPNAQDLFSMLDANSTAGKSSEDSESNLILNKKKDVVG